MPTRFEKEAMKYFLCLVLLFLSQLTYALKTVYLPVELQTKIATPVARKLYLKLPLQQTDSDWVFTHSADLLAGDLELRIIRDNQVVENLSIFSKGKFSQDWQAILPSVPTAPGDMYFGFHSTKAYATAPGDKLELRLQIVKPVKGIGPNSSGVLPKGLYVSSGNYSGLLDEFRLEQTNLYQKILQDVLTAEDKRILLTELARIYNYTAFMNAWNNQWQVAITTESGWLDEYSQPEEASL